MKTLAFKLMLLSLVSLTGYAQTIEYLDVSGKVCAVVSKDNTNYIVEGCGRELHVAIRGAKKIALAELPSGYQVDDRVYLLGTTTGVQVVTAFTESGEFIVRNFENLQLVKPEALSPALKDGGAKLYEVYNRGEEFQARCNLHTVGIDALNQKVVINDGLGFEVRDISALKPIKSTGGGRVKVGHHFTFTLEETYEDLPYYKTGTVIGFTDQRDIIMQFTAQECRIIRPSDLPR